MKILIKTKNLELTSPMTEYINEKIGGLAKFIKKYEEKTNILAEVEIARPSKRRTKGDIYYAEVNMQLPGTLLRATDEGPDIRLAVNSVRDKIQREIRKYKDMRDDTRV